MRYVQKFTSAEINNNHEIFKERLEVYKDAGLDFLASRKYIFDKVSLPKSKVLDIGTGRGLTCLFLGEAGHNVVTLDIDDEMLKIAALNLDYKNLLSKVQLYKMDTYSIDFEEQSFGAVFMVEALHHIEDLNKAFEEIDRVLIANGKIVLSDFNRKGMSVVNKVHRKEGHEHASSSSGRVGAKKWLIEHGYEVKEYEDGCHWVLVAKKEVA
ncbi:MAG: class I SAM-dependent methyltransferase [Candidatus Omnitrophica bacterium]|nr:class I SAM-dependent methyltransferase [Candidatus Omnitrophota bacterium]MBU1128344.1 class I SAM-dependent methyltransferase [Candidatus Omnitrophota bacterium]MBU1784764.1 class I SAM-dependent methyltransferase [Candidatus Omnitrophota bacterium]MBU1851853.1 class I SAM-dependent methyltransferase [Candidatus Omnitrophota bacterium]